MAARITKGVTLEANTFTNICSPIYLDNECFIDSLTHFRPQDFVIKRPINAKLPLVWGVVYRSRGNWSYKRRNKRETNKNMATECIIEMLPKAHVIDLSILLSEWFWHALNRLELVWHVSFSATINGFGSVLRWRWSISIDSLRKPATQKLFQTRWWMLIGRCVYCIRTLLVRVSVNAQRDVFTVAKYIKNVQNCRYNRR